MAFLIFQTFFGLYLHPKKENEADAQNNGEGNTWLDVGISRHAKTEEIDIVMERV